MQEPLKYHKDRNRSLGMDKQTNKNLPAAHYS